MKRPDASVVARATCEGLTAVTVAPAIGVFVAESLTVPAIVPVVPATAGLQIHSSENAATTALTARFRNELLIDPPKSATRKRLLVAANGMLLHNALL